MMNENYNTPNSGCCGRPMHYDTTPKCNYNDCCMNEYAYKQKACIRNKQPDCEAQAVIPSITVETVDGITNLANCLVHVTSTNTTYYVDDKHRIMIAWAGPVNIPGYDMEGNPNHYKNQIVTDTEAQIAVIYDNNGIGYTFGIQQGADIDDAVNAKMNEMIASGYFTDAVDEIVQPQVTEALKDAKDDVDKLIDDANETILQLTQQVSAAKMNLIRKKEYSRFDKVDLPNDITSTFIKDVNVFTNNEGFYTVNYDIESLKNTGGNTWYFSPNGNNSNAGDREHPFKGMNATVWAQISNGDTLIFLEGRYPKSTWSSTYNNKTLNVIGEGDVWFSTSDLNYVWDQYSANVWHTTRSAINAIYDITRLDEGITPALTLVDSIASVAATPNSYYTSGSDVYVHMYDNVEPDNTNIELSLGIGSPWLSFSPSANGKIYIENMNCISAARAGILVNNNNHAVSVLVRNCKIYNVYSDNYTQDAFSNQGCNSICENVEVINCRKDGFNYHSANNINANGIEINCHANNLGYGQTGSNYASNNGTTAHNGCQVLRVNGVYTYANGGVVVDTDNVVSASYGCVIADSYGRSYDVYSGGSAVMYLYDCYSKASRANTNLLTSANGYIYQKDCEYDTSRGNIVDL